MKVVDWGEAGGAAWAGFESATGGGVATALCVGGVETDWCCECTEGVDGAGWGVCMRGAGGVWECTMGGVWPRARLTGGAMCRCEETTTGEACGCGWNWRGGMAYCGGGC